MTSTTRPNVDHAHPVRTKFPRTSRRSAALAGSLRTVAKPALNVWSYVPSLSRLSGVMDRTADKLTLPIGTSVRTVQLGPCDAEWIRASRARDDGAVLYLRGGAFIVCSLASHRRLVASTSRVTRQPVLNVNFRMLPEVTLEGMIADCLAGYRWLLDEGFPADRISVVGDSAGGYLAFAVALALRDEGLPMPASITGLSPLLDLGVERKEASPHRDKCDLFTVRSCRALQRLIAHVDDEHEADGERVCPIDADLSGLPPVLIQMGSREILRPDAEVMVDRLAEAGVPTQLQIWTGQVHVFQAAASWVPEAAEAMREIGRFVRANLAQSTGSVRTAREASARVASSSSGG
ncbi:esterase [Flexivirga endophytica]|uniref:Esterase n=1 Tax=Flexivirga endophytica TaxID=1849103 RepID=A0A916TKU5_9MICO|nr:alpha/beta hydrolase [Flexivirga endophytica]GGB46160.1 esterase [Flexivirga endophytica]GHB69937.1 esterase [Flexivirga endophytica]